jgi:hypothetical protein
MIRNNGRPAGNRAAKRSISLEPWTPDLATRALATYVHGVSPQGRYRHSPGQIGGDTQSATAAWSTRATPKSGPLVAGFSPAELIAFYQVSIWERRIELSASSPTVPIAPRGPWSEQCWTARAARFHQIRIERSEGDLALSGPTCWPVTTAAVTSSSQR